MYEINLVRVLKFSQFDLKPQIKELMKRAGCYILIIKNESKPVRKPKQRSWIDEWTTNEQAKEPCLISKSHSWYTKRLTVERAAARPLATSAQPRRTSCGGPRGRRSGPRRAHQSSARAEGGVPAGRPADRRWRHDKRWKHRRTTRARNWTSTD